MAFGLSKLLNKKKRGLIKERWKYDLQNYFLASPIIADLRKTGEQTILLATNSGKIIALNDKGNMKWTFDAREHMDSTEALFFDEETANSIQSTPVTYDLFSNGRNEIIFGSEMGTLYVIDSFGHLLWNFRAKGSIKGSVVIGDVNNDGQPEIIFGSGDKHIYILTKKGELLKKFNIGCKIESTPETIGDKIIFGCDDGHIRCINYEGQELWKYQTGAKILAQPFVGKLEKNGKTVVVIGSLDHYLYMINDLGELVWKFKTDGAIYSKPAFADVNKDGRLDIIFGSCDNNVYAIKATGEKIWSYETGFWIVAPVIVDDIDKDGKLEVVAGSYDHNIYILDAKGNYMLDYVPGLAGVMQQTGSYSDVMTSEPGKRAGKKLWQYQTEGIVVGCALMNQSNIISITRNGKINNLEHTRGE